MSIFVLLDEKTYGIQLILCFKNTCTDTKCKFFYQVFNNHVEIPLGWISGIVFENGKTNRWIQAEKACTGTWNNRNINSTNRIGQNGRGLPKGSSRATKLDRTVGTYHWTNAAQRQRDGPTCSG